MERQRDSQTLPRKSSLGREASSGAAIVTRNSPSDETRTYRTKHGTTAKMRTGNVGKGKRALHQPLAERHRWAGASHLPNANNVIDKAVNIAAAALKRDCHRRRSTSSFKAELAPLPSEIMITGDGKLIIAEINHRAAATSPTIDPHVI